MTTEDINLLESLYIKILSSNGIKKGDVEIEEKNLNFAVNVKIKKNIPLKGILSILKSFDKIEKYSEKYYSTELEIYFPYMTLYMDKYDD